jgi:hypothetical protein
MGSAKISPAAAPRRGQSGTVEARNSKLEIGNWTPVLSFEFSSFGVRFSLTLTPRSGKKMGGIKKIYERTRQVIENKG